MKHFFATLFLFFAVNVFSQDSTSNQKSIERIVQVQHRQVVQRITKLNTEQQQQLKTIFDDFGKELLVLKNKQGRQKLEYIKSINAQKDKKALKVLSAEQRKIYEALIKEWEEKMQERRKQRQ